MEKKRSKSLSYTSLYSLNYYNLFWVFVLMCIFGVLYETTLVFLRHQIIESRSGLIYGPFNPVYGVGGVLITALLMPLSKQRYLWILLPGMVIGGIFEYVCSFFQEKIFGTVSWNYQNNPLNLGNRTNLAYCFIWGLLGLFWVKVFYPKFAALIKKVPKKILKPLTIAMTVFMILNMLISFTAVYRQSERRKGIPASNFIMELIDKYYTDEFLSQIYTNAYPTE